MTNQYTYSVPFSEEELHDCYIKQEMTQAEIAKRFGTTQKVVWLAMKKMKMPARKSVARNQAREANNNWKGGRVLAGVKAGNPNIESLGYWYIHSPKHPNATKSGYVAEHIKVATDQRGKPLQKGECVHHIDLDKQNNSQDNLAIADRKTHANWHIQLQRIAASLVQQGLVSFDPSRGYKLKEIAAK